MKGSVGFARERSPSSVPRETGGRETNLTGKKLRNLIFFFWPD